MTEALFFEKTGLTKQLVVLYNKYHEKSDFIEEIRQKEPVNE